MMFAVSYQRTMAGAKPKFPESDVVVRSIELIRREKRTERDRLQRESAEAWARRMRSERDEAQRKLAQLQALCDYRVIDVRGPGTPVRQIIERVAAFHGMNFQRVVGVRRDKQSVAARFDAIEAVAKARPDLSLPQIGRHFNRDHTSILHALRRRGVPDRRSPANTMNGAAE